MHGYFPGFTCDIPHSKIISRFDPASFYIEISTDSQVGKLNYEEYKQGCSSLVHGNFHGFTSGMVKIGGL